MIALNIPNTIGYRVIQSPDLILPGPAQQHPIETRYRNSKWTQRDDYGNYINTNIKQLPPMHGEGRNQAMHANHI